MRNLLAHANGLCEFDGGGASHADDTVSAADAAYSIVDDALGHVDEGRVEDAGVEVGYQRLDAASQAYAGGARHDERRNES